MTAISSLRGFLDAEGLTAGYTIRYHRFDDADPDVASGRVLLFREDANGSADVYVQRHYVSVYVIGSGDTDIQATEAKAAAIARACRTNTTGTAGAYKLNTLNNPRSPMFMADDRPMIEVVVEVFTEDT